MMKIGFVSFAGVASLVLIAAFAMSIYAVVELQKVGDRHRSVPLLLQNQTNRTAKEFGTVFSGKTGSLKFHGNLTNLGGIPRVRGGSHSVYSVPNQWYDVNANLVLEATSGAVDDVLFEVT